MIDLLSANCYKRKVEGNITSLGSEFIVVRGTTMLSTF